MNTEDYREQTVWLKTLGTVAYKEWVMNETIEQRIVSTSIEIRIKTLNAVLQKQAVLLEYYAHNLLYAYNLLY